MQKVEDEGQIVPGEEHFPPFERDSKVWLNVN